MYWQSEGFPAVSREQMFACKLHSYAAIFAVIKREILELQKAMACNACFDSSLDICAQLDRAHIGELDLTGLKVARNQLYESLADDFNRAFREQVCERGDRYLLDDSWYVIGEVLEILDGRLKETQENGLLFDGWSRMSRDEIIGATERVLQAMAMRSRYTYNFVVNRPATDQTTYSIQFTAEQESYLVPALAVDVLRDLVANARKYSQPGTTITVKLIQDEERFDLMVSDEGRGIAEVDLPHVVEFGYRGGNVSRNETMVGGLGLTKAWLVAGACDGHLWIDSDEGNGTSVGLSVPLPIPAAGTI
jgi:hypothetical protein